jgi:hypothetical protein
MNKGILSNGLFCAGLRQKIIVKILEPQASVFLLFPKSSNIPSAWITLSCLENQLVIFYKITTVKQ